MEQRRDTWSATIRLAMALSVTAAAAALVLNAIGEVPRAALIGVVMLVGFVASWVLSGRTSQPIDTSVRPHRIAVVPLRQTTV